MDKAEEETIEKGKSRCKPPSIMKKRCTVEMIQNITVEIAGREYQLRTDEDPEYIRQLASIVTAKVLEIKRDSGASALDCATMAALDFADRYCKEVLKKKHPAKKQAANAQTSNTQAAAEPPTLL